MEKKNVIIGAGLAGLSASYHMKKPHTVLEAKKRVGGECITDKVGDFCFDKAGHLLHLGNKSVHQLIEKLLPGKLNLLERDARIFLQGKEYRYPFQANLFGLSPEKKAVALLDYLKAAVITKKARPANFAAWCNSNFGNTITELFLKPYNTKLWTVSPEKLTLDWMGKFVPRPQVKRVIEGAFSDIRQGGGYNASFYYPQKGGIDLLANAFASQTDHIRLNSAVTGIDIKNKKIIVNKREKISWTKIISSMPLPALVSALTDPPAGVISAMKKLSWNSVLVINLGIMRRKIRAAHWLYFPDQEYSFYRSVFPGNFGKTIPAWQSSLSVEVAMPAGKGWDERKKISSNVRRELIKAGIILASDEITCEHIQYIPYAYVIYDREYAKARQYLLDYFAKKNICCIGRWGNWNYSAMEDAILAGKEAAEQK